MTPQQKDEDDRSFCVALSLFALVLLALMRFSSSLSSKISESSLVSLGQTVVEEGGRRQVWFGLAKEGVRDGIQKGRGDSREERPMI
jgi:hypothetical protein